MKREKFTAEQVKDTKCGFCGKTREEVKSLVVGLAPEVAICDECVTYAAELVELESS